MSILARELSAEFERQRPGQRVQVEGLGSERGITAWLAGDLDIAASSRQLTDDERQSFFRQHGARPIERIIAMDAVCIYVHPGNPLTTISRDDLTRIFAGEIRNWNEVGGPDRRIDVYTRDETSGTRTFVEQTLLGSRRFSALAQDVSSTPLLMAAVARNQGAIGFGGVAYGQGVRVLRLRERAGEAGAYPGQDDVAAGRYPLARPLWLLINPKRKPEAVTKFVDWTCSDAGRKVVAFVGFLPPSAAGPTVAMPSSERTVLRRDNLDQHGFDLTVRSTPVDGAPDHRRVRVQLASGSAAIGRVATVRLRVGDELDASLALVDGGVEFLLRTTWIERSEVWFVERGERGRIHTLSLRDFVDAK